MTSLHALIPIRSGSQRFPNKNIYKINGVPLFVLSAYAALCSDIFDSVTIASDSYQYLDLANQYSLGTYHRTPSSSQANSPSEAVMLEYVNHMNLPGNSWIFLIQATSPFQQVSYFLNAKQLVESGTISSIVTASDFKGFFLEDILNGDRPMTQDKKARLLETGLFWGTRISQLRKTNRRLSDPYAVVKVDRNDTLDIDYEQDLLVNKCRLESHMECLQKTLTKGSRH